MNHESNPKHEHTSTAAATAHRPGGCAKCETVCNLCHPGFYRFYLPPATRRTVPASGQPGDIACTFGIAVHSGTYDVVAILGEKVNQLIRIGQVWRLITPVFLHDSNLPYGLLHIGFNMYALFLYGRGLEARFGHWRFTLLYFLSAYAGNVFSFLLTPNPSLGASTAIFGLLAAEGMFVFQNRQLLGNRAGRALMNVLYVAGINLLIGFSTSGGGQFWTPRRSAGRSAFHLVRRSALEDGGILPIHPAD